MKTEKNKVVFSFNNLSIAIKQQVSFLKQTTRMILKETDLVLNEGEIVSLIGYSGSGKSLLAECILNNQADNIKVSGDRFFENKPVHVLNNQNWNKVECCYIPQTTLALNPLLTIEKQFKLFSYLPLNKHTVDQVLLTVGLPPEVRNHYPHELSGGMKKKLLYAFSLLSQAKIIIADEPMRGLDDLSKNQLNQIMLKQSQQGHSLLVITHDLLNAIEISDRILMISLDAKLVEVYTATGKSPINPILTQYLAALPEQKFIKSI